MCWTCSDWWPTWVTFPVWDVVFPCSDRPYIWYANAQTPLRTTLLFEISRNNIKCNKKIETTIVDLLNMNFGNGTQLLKMLLKICWPQTTLAAWLCHALPAPLSLNFAQTMEACDCGHAHEILLSKENEESRAQACNWHAASNRWALTQK